MKTPASVPLSPWVNGIQNVNDPAMTPKGCVVEANNVYIDSGGVVTPRLGYDLVSTGVSSLVQHNGRTYGVVSGHIAEILDTGARALMPGIVGPVTWGVLNEELVFTNNYVLGRISNDVAELLGVEEPNAVRPLTVPSRYPPDASTIATYPERYFMAVSFVSRTGEEGPLSGMVEATSIGLPQPIEPAVTHIRVYQTKPDGDILYHQGDVPVGTTSANIVSDCEFDRVCETQFKARMPGGSFVRYWRGRLLVARNRTLYFSDPLRYGMYDRASGYIPFEAKIIFIEPVEGGVYVGLKDAGVRFLAGDTPGKLENKLADITDAQPSASMVLPTAGMALEMQFPPDWAAVWFTNKGFALGLPTGVVIYPQAKLLSGLPLGNGSLAFEGDRLIVLVQ